MVLEKKLYRRMTARRTLCLDQEEKDVDQLKEEPDAVHDILNGRSFSTRILKITKWTHIFPLQRFQGNGIYKLIGGDSDADSQVLNHKR